MVGSKPTTFSSRVERLDDEVWQPGTVADRRGECELCRSETVTNRRYGLRVCLACEEEYLP